MYPEDEEWYVDFSSLTYGTTYNKIIYESPHFYYLDHILDRWPAWQVKLRLAQIRYALGQLEALDIADWDEFNNQYPYGLPQFKPIPAGKRQLIFIRRQALHLFLEAIGAFPWSFLDPALYSKEQQLALFLDGDAPETVQLELILEDIGDPDNVLDGSPYYSSQDLFPTASTFTRIWDTNPLDPLFVALTFIASAEYSWAGSWEGQFTIEDVVHDLPDYLRWTLNFCHNFQHPLLWYDEDGMPVHDKTKYANPSTEPDVSYFEEPLVYNVVRQASAPDDPDTPNIEKFWTWIWNEFVLPHVGPASAGVKTYFEIGANTYLMRGENTGAAAFPGQSGQEPSVPYATIGFWDIANYGHTGGCHNVSTWMQSVFRAMLIPTYPVIVGLGHYQRKKNPQTQQYEVKFAPKKPHGSLYCPQLDVALHDGDDVFSDNWLQCALPGRFRWFNRSVLQKMTGLTDDFTASDAEGMTEFLEQYYDRWHAAFSTFLWVKPYRKLIENRLGSYCSLVVYGSECCQTDGGTMKAFEDSLDAGEEPFPLSDGIESSIGNILEFYCMLGYYCKQEWWVCPD